MKKMNSAILSFYNIMYTKDIEQVDLIPPDILNNMLLYTYKELYRPLVSKMITEGKTLGRIAIATGLTEAEVRNIGRVLRLLC